MTTSISLYIHIPYCLEKCPYCDFHSVATVKSAIPAAAYAKILLQQWRREAERWGLAARPIHSVYFGGGTPSLMPTAFFASVLDGAGNSDLEITVETNPASADRKAFRQWRRLGINRISFGTQSFQDRLLQKLGRRHTAAEGRCAVEEARAAGFENINCDLIFGIEGETLNDLEKDLQTVLALRVPHVSAYQLTVEPHTPLAHAVQSGQTILPAEGRLLAMHRLVSQTLPAARLPRYEISNYARPGWESRHNLHTWRGGDYLGIGSGAVSKVGRRRWRTTRKIKNYLAGCFEPEEEEILDDKTAWKEKWMMGLRLAEGVSLEEREGVGQSLFAEWEAAGWAACGEGRVRLTPEGLLLTSALTQNVFAFIDQLC